jgi:hypothetical protein
MTPHFPKEEIQEMFESKYKAPLERFFSYVSTSINSQTEENIDIIVAVYKRKKKNFQEIEKQAQITDENMREVIAKNKSAYGIITRDILQEEARVSCLELESKYFDGGEVFERKENGKILFRQVGQAFFLVD